MSFFSGGSWTPAPPAIIPFQPTYLSPLGTSPDGSHFWVNPLYFASEETAQYMARRFGAKHVEQRPYQGQNAAFTCDKTEAWLFFPAGVAVKDYFGYDTTSPRDFYMNAGELAGFFIRNPEAQFPGLADKMVRQAMGQAARI